MTTSANAQVQIATVAERIAALRVLAKTDPQAAQDAAWSWMERVGAQLPEHTAELELAEMFALGDPADVDGQTVGMLVGFLEPAADLDRGGQFLHTAAQIVVNRLGLMPWLGKKFDKAAQRGTNSMTTLAAVALPILVRYPLRRAGQYWEGFPMLNRIEESVVSPGTQVLVLDYENEGSNPWPVNSIRDEATQIVPGTYLGAKLWHQESGYRQLAFWAAKTPV